MIRFSTGLKEVSSLVAQTLLVGRSARLTEINCWLLTGHAVCVCVCWGIQLMQAHRVTMLGILMGN